MMRNPPAALGIDLGGTKIEAVLLAADGSQAWRQRVPTPAGDYAGTVAAVAALVDAARAVAGTAITIGVGTPGSARADGRMKNCNSTWLNGRPLQRDIEAAVGAPVALANDADCLALSEATDGAGAGAAVVFAAIVGTGVGGGLAVDGRVVRGPNGLTGEWGHNPLPWPGADEQPPPACYCGRRGCVEAWLSGPALAAVHARKHGGRATAQQIGADAARGDAAAAATLARHADRFARATATVIHVLDPDVIVVGGGLSQLTSLYADVPKLWPRWVFGAAGSGGDGDAGFEPVRTRLVAARHGDASGVRGAAWLGARAAATQRR